MATVQLSDLVVPEVYAGYMDIDSPEITAFYDSGVIAQNPMLDEHASGPSNVTTLPFWRDLDSDDEPNISSDNPADKSVPRKIGTGKQIAMVAYLNNSWSAMDLVKELAGDDPVQAILRKTNRYWRRQWQRRLVASAVGIYLDNAANDDGDMVYDISKPDAGAPGDTNKFGGAAAIRTILTMGDQLGEISAMAVHSVVYGKMLEDDLIEFIQPSDGPGQIPTYQGKLVLYDDGMPVEDDGNDNVIYTSIFYGNAVFGFGRGMPKVPVAVTRDETAGDGAGQEILHERHTWLLHPTGFAFDPQVPAKLSASLAELRSAAAWDRVVERKNVPMAFLRTNG